MLKTSISIPGTQHKNYCTKFKYVRIVANFTNSGNWLVLTFLNSLHIFYKVCQWWHITLKIGSTPMLFLMLCSKTTTHTTCCVCSHTTCCVCSLLKRKIYFPYFTIIIIIIISSRREQWDLPLVFLHPHIIRCITVARAGGSLVETGTNMSPSSLHPYYVAGCSRGWGISTWCHTMDWTIQAARPDKTPGAGSHKNLSS